MVLAAKEEQKLGGGGLPPLDGFARSIHQTQYDSGTADFFEIFNRLTGRPELYYGYLAGRLKATELHSKNGGNGSTNKQRIAVDFGCGTGWLTSRLPQLGFSRVYGIDTSPAMLGLAFNRTSRELTTNGLVCYRNEIPESIIGKCSLVTAVHVHYHFEPLKKLQSDFFGAISSLLAPEGEAILVGCPSDFVHDTPDHYRNSIHKNDIPKDIIDKSSSLAFLADKDDYVPLSCLPPFPLKDGTQMKVTFSVQEPNGTRHEKSLIDTFWSDKALAHAAETAGLDLIGQQNLICGRHENAYMMMHLKKSAHPMPALGQ